MSDLGTPSVVPIVRPVVPKPWWESWTIKYSTIKSALGIITAIYGFVLASHQNGTLPFVVDETWMLWIGGLIALLDGLAGIGLRFRTDSPVTRSKA